MEVETTTKPDLRAVIRGRVQKSCGYAGLYASRTLELLPDGVLYAFLDGMDRPHSKIYLDGCVLRENSDSPNGFTIANPAQDKKQKIICADVEAKRLWLRHLQDRMATLQTSTTSSANAASASQAIDRSGEPLLQGSLLKRSGITSSYSVRWCEVWRNVGLVYAKYRSAADDAFKLVPLRGARIVVAESKARIAIHPPSAAASPTSSGQTDVVYLRFDDVVELGRWKQGLAIESGADWVDIGGDDFGATVSLGAAPEPPTPLDSEDEREIADLESEVPIQQCHIRVDLESVSRTVNADLDTEGFDAVLRDRLKSFGDYGFVDLLDQLEERLHVPLYAPHSAVVKHLAALDLDAQYIRRFLCQLLDEFPREVKVVLVAERADLLLTEYKHARDVFLVRRDIAEYCEHQGQGSSSGHHSANDMVQLLDRLPTTNPVVEATRRDVDRAQLLIKELQRTLSTFRIEYDVYDDAYYAIDAMESAIESGKRWVVDVERALRTKAI